MGKKNKKKTIPALNNSGKQQDSVVLEGEAVESQVQNEEVLAEENQAEPEKVSKKEAKAQKDKKDKKEKKPSKAGKRAKSRSNGSPHGLSRKQNAPDEPGAERQPDNAGERGRSAVFPASELAGTD